MPGEMFARVASATVIGIEAAAIDVEVDVGVGLPCCSIVGLPDAGIALNELTGATCQPWLHLDEDCSTRPCAPGLTCVGVGPDGVCRSTICGN